MAAVFYHFTCICRFLLLQSVQRSDGGTVELANIVAVLDNKQDAFVQYEILKLLGVSCFIVPTFQDYVDGEETQLQDIRDEQKLTPAEFAKIYRQYYNRD